MVQSLCGQLLLASPALTDSNFRRAVVLIGVHGGSYALIASMPPDPSVN
jgi:putative AlgH/UPF0301 family transcriptional regulator